ncbi:hypothetical protein HGB07_02835 [Candidatus Roizmanbacteria bacterium]|nr:hypothetical protein [Candidatus Roizmanbacteria bacterium]
MSTKIDTKQTFAKKELNLNLLSKPPIFAADGQMVNVIDDNNLVDIVFFQLVNQNAKELNVNGISAIRLSFKQLKQFASTLGNVIKEIEERTVAIKVKS